MKAYMYKADLHCEDCGKKLQEALDFAGKRPADPDDEHTYDSDDYPKGPYPDGGGDADSPHHCGTCGRFLENPLTRDGCEYVAGAFEGAVEEGRADSVALTTWLRFYFKDVNLHILDAMYARARRGAADPEEQLRRAVKYSIMITAVLAGHGFDGDAPWMKQARAGE